MDYEAYKSDVIASFARIRDSVKQAAERIPAGQEAFSPWEGAINLGAQFIEMCNGATVYLNRIEGKADPREGMLDRGAAYTAAQLAEAVAQNTAESRRRLEAIPAEALAETRETRSGPVPVWRLMRSIRDHDIHHRGQVFTMLRMVGAQPTSLNLGLLVWDRDEVIETMRRVRASTIESWRRFPADRLDFRPWEKAYSARELALHLATAAAGLPGMISGARPNIPWTADSDHAGILKALEDSLAMGAEAHRALTEEQLGGMVTLRSGAQVPARNWAFVWRDHEIHHRAQLMLYCRMVGVEPGRYAV